MEYLYRDRYVECDMVTFEDAPMPPSSDFVEESAAPDCLCL